MKIGDTYRGIKQGNMIWPRLKREPPPAPPVPPAQGGAQGAPAPVGEDLDAGASTAADPEDGQDQQGQLL